MGDNQNNMGKNNMEPWEKKYEKIAELGQGGNATVFRVSEKETKKIFALKN